MFSPNLYLVSISWSSLIFLTLATDKPLLYFLSTLSINTLLNSTAAGTIKSKALLGFIVEITPSV